MQGRVFLQYRNVNGTSFHNERTARVERATGGQVQYLRSEGHVQRRYRFVQHDQPGSRGQRPGDGDTLALATAEFVRVSLGVEGVQSHYVQHSCTCERTSDRLNRWWVTSGSAIIWSTRIRGFSELQGS